MPPRQHSRHRREVVRQARPEDAIVLYYAGHGISIGDRYYLVPQDLPFDGLPSQLVEKGANALAKGGISDLDLRDALSAEQASEAAIILDACQSGAVTGNEVVQRRGPMDSAGLRQFAWDKGIDILAASLSTQSAKEQSSIEHGVLTHALFNQGLLRDLAGPANPIGHDLKTQDTWLRWVPQQFAQARKARLQPEASTLTSRKV